MNMTRFVLIVLVFFVDVQVKAGLSYQKMSEPIQEPLRCLSQNVVCVISTFEKSKYSLTLGAAEVVLGGRTTIIRNDADQITLISGEIWVRSNGPIKIGSEFGTFELNRSSGWVIKEGGRMLVRTSEGAGVLTPRGGTELGVPAGFEMWVSAVDSSGVAQTSVPTAIDFRDHMRRWAKLFPGTRLEFKKEVTAFRDTWFESVEKASTFHFETVQRGIASEQDARRRQDQVLEKIKRENQRLRKLFRKKLSIED
jgi:hypothetical protein